MKEFFVKYRIVLVAVAITLAVLIAIRMFVGSPANAQTATSSATSGSSASLQNESSSQSQSSGGQALAQGGNVTFNTPGETRSRNTVENKGTYTVRSAPAVQAPSMGSGHPCGMGNSVGISLIGGGGSAGVTSVDDACLLLQAGIQDAGIRMIAARNPDACVQLRATGHIPAGSVCTGKERRDAAQAQRAAATAPAANPLASKVTCERDASGTLTRIVVKRGTDPEAARAYCG